MGARRRERIAELRAKLHPEEPAGPERMPPFKMDALLTAEATGNVTQWRSHTGAATLALAGDELVLTDFDGTELDRAPVQRNEWVTIRYERGRLTVEPQWVRDIGPQTLEVDQFITARVSEFAPAMLDSVQKILAAHDWALMTWTPSPVCLCCMGDGEPTHQMSFGTVSYSGSGEFESTYEAGPWWLPHVDYPCQTVRLLATQFADHPAFNEAWRAAE